jgi:hypothetical protein
MKGATPPVMVRDDHLDGLREEIVGKIAQFEKEAWWSEEP